jgi:hypothetical protein
VQTHALAHTERTRPLNSQREAGGCVWKSLTSRLSLSDTAIMRVSKKRGPYTIGAVAPERGGNRMDGLCTRVHLLHLSDTNSPAPGDRTN